jgi:hypothetical protein
MKCFVHSLVRTTTNQRLGWCAPWEMGEAAPQSIGFVIPVDEKGGLRNSYACETVKGLGSDERATVSRSLVKVGGDSFRLKLDEGDIWFTARSSPKKNRLLPYLGKLKHPDFDSLLIEIEPERQAALDRLCEETGEFVIGCDPFLHYEGIDQPTLSSASDDGKPTDYEPLWNFANADLPKASRLLNFICATGFTDVQIRKKDFRELREAVKTDPNVLYAWDVGSRYVREIAERLKVHRRHLASFLRRNGFDASVRKNPRRARRDQWFNSWKQVGS